MTQDMNIYTFIIYRYNRNNEKKVKICAKLSSMQEKS